MPIAVLSYDEERYEQDYYTMEFPFFKMLTFNFYTIELQKENWREYIESDNPVAAALLSKMNYTDEERVQVRIEFLRMMTRMELDPARARLINGIFEQYLKLTKQEEEQLMEEIKQMEEAEEILHLPNSWEEKGIEKGKLVEKRNNAIEMLKNGASDSFIMKVTKLDKEELEELKEELD
ncbi:hypothetical protein [Lentibacillus sediminis]|uniref:hypothetical protein n=1 Tax=Lentibacillus sediminis TaxID=1940529 RepID=UPI001EFDA039|nr:hypothetical protein [Lentibacillus sediminis]